jgi:hypothetical protein
LNGKHHELEADATVIGRATKFVLQALSNVIAIAAAIAVFVTAIVMIAELPRHPFVPLLVPLVIGIYWCARGAITAPDPRSRLAAFLHKIDELTSIVLISPMVLCICGGLAGLIVVRPLHWLAKAMWPKGTVQSLWDWPTGPSDIATGLLGVDRLIWWSVTDAPFEFWLIAFIPALWFGASLVPFAVVKLYRAL